MTAMARPKCPPRFDSLPLSLLQGRHIHSKYCMSDGAYSPEQAQRAMASGRLLETFEQARWETLGAGLWGRAVEMFFEEL